MKTPQEIQELIRQRRGALAGQETLAPQAQPRGQGPDVRSLIRSRRRLLHLPTAPEADLPAPQASLLAQAIESSFGGPREPARAAPVAESRPPRRRRSALDILQAPPPRADDVRAEAPEPVTPQGTQTAPAPYAFSPGDDPEIEEAKFRAWYGRKATELGLDPNPDDPRHFYDYRAAWRAGADAKVIPEDGLPHWPSEFKRPGHPNLVVDGLDTRTGEPLRPETADSITAARAAVEPPSTGGGLPEIPVRADLRERPDVTAAVPVPERRKRTLGETAFDVFVANAMPGFLSKEAEDRAIERMDPNAPGKRLPFGYHGGDIIGLAAEQGTIMKETLGYLGILGKVAGGVVGGVASRALPGVTSMPVVTRMADAIIEKTGVSREVAGKVAGRVAGAIDGLFKGASEGVVFGALRQPLEGEEVTPEALAAYAAGGAFLQAVIGAAGGRGWSLADPTARVGRVQDEMADPYAALGIQRGAGRAEVDAAFRQKATPFHPDRNKGPMAEEIFKRYSAAKEAILGSKSPEEAIRAYSKTMGATAGAEPAAPAPEAPAAEPSARPRTRGKGTAPSPTEEATRASTESPTASGVTEAVTAQVPEQPARPTPKTNGMRRRMAEAIDPSLRTELEEAYRDPMTGLPNPSAFARSRERLDSDPAWHVASVDISQLKAINDNPEFGRGVADQRIAEVAGVLREEAEKRGIAPRDVMRAGGDEFAVWGKDPNVLQEVVDATKARIRPLQIGPYASHVRGAVGSDWLQAEAATQAQKAQEQGPRARDVKVKPVEAETPASPESSLAAEEAGLAEAETAAYKEVEPPDLPEPMSPEGRRARAEAEEEGLGQAEIAAYKEYEPPDVTGTKKPVTPQLPPAAGPGAGLPSFVTAQHRKPPAEATATPGAPLEGHGERTRRVEIKKGKVVPGQGATTPTVTYEETYADGTEVTRAEDGSVLSAYTPEAAAAAAPAPEEQTEAPTRASSMPGWAREAMLRAGLDPSRPLNDIDIRNPSVIEAINADPTLTGEQKATLLRTGSLTPQAAPAVATEPAAERTVSPQNARREGKDAFKAGQPRVPPAHLTTAQERKAWLAGWDTANLAKPVPEATEAAPEPTPEGIEPTTTTEAPDELGGRLEAGPPGEVSGPAPEVSEGREPGAPSERVGGKGEAGEGVGHEPAPTAEPPALGLRGEGEDAGLTEPAGGRDRPARGGAPAPEQRNGPRRGPAGVVDFHIRDEHDIGGGGIVTKARQNLRAIELLKSIEAEGRHATVEEQAELARYVGWGGIPQVFETVDRLIPDNLKDIATRLRELLTEEEFAEARSGVRNQHFTSVPVIRAMYDALARLGVDGGRFLEPSVGVGNFLGLTPDEWRVRWTAIEKDGVSARIARLLYPHQEVVHAPFEKAVTPAGTYDVAISNVPFADTPVVDKSFRGARRALAGTLHDYFFAKSIEKVRPGGIIAFITSTGTMDKGTPAVRSYLSEHAELLGAIRLPNGAFERNANTRVSTDIIFLRRREQPLPRGATPEGETWTAVEEVEREGADGYAELFKLNEYFVRHPEMVLGDLVHGRGMYGEGEQMVELEDIGTLPDRLNEAITNLPEGVYTPAERVATEPEMVAPSSSKKGSFEIGDDGKLYVEDMGKLTPLDIPKSHVARVKALVGLRDATREVFRTQVENRPAAEREKARAKLNKLYDAFRKKHGAINQTVRRTRTVRTKQGPEERVYYAFPNVRYFEDDPDIMRVRALEDFDAETGRAEKNPVFTHDVIAAPEPLVHTTDPAEALIASLDEVGHVDLAVIASKLQVEAEAVPGLLGDRAYHDPASGQWEIAARYLSGNVREKLRLAEQAARQDPRFKRNAEALRAVIPADIAPEQIKANIGAAWIHGEVYQDFMRGIGLPARVSYSQVSNKWDVIGSGSRALSAGEWGTEDYSAFNLLESLLNQSDITVKRRSGDSYVVDEPATVEARAKAGAMAEHFRSWVWESQWRDELATRYNEMFNSWRIQEYDGSHLTLPGKNLLVAPRSHQLDGIARFLQDGNTLLAHVVGGGKTYTIVGAFMEAKRLGLVNKPMIAVPNNVLPQFAASAQHMYPNARILAATAEDASKKNRELLMSRIATGDWDLIIVSHPSFKALPVSPELAVEHLEEEVADLRLFLGQAREKHDRSTVKEIEKAIDNRTARIQKLLEAKTTELESVTWEELGVDALAVDEADLFKNLSFPTHMGRLVNTSVSGRAEDLMMKVRHLRKINPTHHLIFATGTPVSNSITELWTMTRYLAPQRLEELGMEFFDNWAKTFAETKTTLETAPEGGYRMKERLASYANVPELVRIFRTFADVQSREDLNLPAPPVVGGRPEVIDLPGSDALLEGMKSIRARAESIRARRVDPTVDNLLKLSGDARKLTLDARLMDELAPDDPDSKANRAVAEIHETWENTRSLKGTQLVFVDFSSPASKGFSVPKDMKAKLVARGIPDSEIAFIQDAKTESAKLDLFDRVNRGDVRILFGSTEAMGAGTNVQQRLVRLHHLDAPWRPRDIEQREGRIIRQGNELFDSGAIPGVQISYYVVEGSFDQFMFQTLHRKSAFIAQAMKGDPNIRELEELDEGALTFEEIAAITSGDPMFRERVELDGKVKQLEMLERGHRQRLVRLQSEIRANTDLVKHLRSRQAGLESDAESVEDTTGDKFSVVLGKETYAERGAAGEALSKIVVGANLKPGEFRNIGQFAGFQLRLLGPQRGTIYQFELRGKEEHATEAPHAASPAGLVQRLENLGRRVAGAADANASRIAELEAEIKRAEEVSKKPYERADELAAARARLREVTEELQKRSEQHPTPEGEATPPEEGEEPGQVRERAAQYHARAAFGSVEAEADAARAIVEIAGDFAETPDGPLDARKRLEVMEGLRDRVWVSVAGKKIRSALDAHRVLAPFFRSKTVEILHAVYTDENGVVLANHAVTSGALDYVQLAGDWESEFRRVGKELGAKRLWVVHNHPSGDPTPSQDDFNLWRQLRDGLAGDGIEVKGVVIDSDTYADLEKLESIRFDRKAMSASLAKVRAREPEPQYERVSGPEVARMLMRTHHDPQKFSILYLDSAHQATALELHPHERLGDFDWLKARTSAYGARTVILGVTGNPVPLARQLIQQYMTGDEPGSVLDVIEVGEKPHGRSAREILFADWVSQPPRSFREAQVLREETPDYDARSPATVRDEGTEDRVPEIRPEPEPKRLIPDDIEGGYTEAAKALVKAVPRHYRYRKDKAKKTAERWRKLLTEEQREDLGGYVEGIGNIRTGKSAETIRAEVEADAKLQLVVSEYRDLQEKARRELNAFLEDLHGPEYVKYLEDYLLHFYAGPAKKRTSFARGWVKKVPSAAKRKIPTLDDALDAGLTPITQDVAELHQLWAELNWKGAINQRFVYELAHIRNEDGQPVIQKPQDAPADWVYVDHPAIQRVYARRAEDGTLVLWRGGAMVDPVVYQPLRQVFDHPLTWSAVRAVETANAFAKKAALSLSFFHHFALTESAEAALPRWWNPLRGLALAERGLRGGVPLVGGLRLTTPHREGLRLLESPEFMRDVTLHGLNIDPIPDVMAGRVVRALRGLEARTRTIPGLSYVTRAVRRFNDAWDNLLWNRYYTGLKAFTYYDLVHEQMQRMPDDATPAEVRKVKEKIAELVNDMFGGQEWQGKFWLTPQGRQVLHVALLAPDWTLTNINVATKPFRDVKDPTARRILARYWRNLLLGFFAVVAGATRALGGKWPWEQEPDHKFDIDVTSIMRKLPWTDKDDQRRYYIKPGKQFREVLRYLTSPVDIVGAKLSPMVQVIIEQMTGHQTGQAGWEMPWVQDELTWYESLPSRIASVMDKFVPFSARGGNFALTFPMSRGMSWYKAQKAYEDVIRAQVDPSIYDRLMPGRDAERLKKEIDAAATLNGLDPEEQYKQANTKVRSEYYSRMWRALEDEEMGEAEGAAAILWKLGVSDTGALESGERRGVTEEQVEAAVRLFPGRHRRAPRKPTRKPRPERRK